jgi:hypothetical protein
MMYGLKPVPFKAVSVRFKALHVARAGLVIRSQLCALVFAVGGDRYCDDGDQDDRKNDGEPAQQVEAVVEEAAKAVRIDVAWRFLGQKLRAGREEGNNGDEFAVNAQCD